jgi:hypothetical protein
MESATYPLLSSKNMRLEASSEGTGRSPKSKFTEAPIDKRFQNEREVGKDAQEECQ